MQKKKEAIEKTMDYEEIWECEIQAMLEKSRWLQRRAQRLGDTKSLQSQQNEVLPEQIDDVPDLGSIIIHDEFADLDDDDEPSTDGTEEREVDPGMAEFFDNCKVSGPIELHDAFFGGRVGPEKIFSTTIGKPGKKIMYRDVNSLYPMT